MAGTMLVGNFEIAASTTDSAAAVAFFRSGSLEMVNSVLAMGSLALAAGVVIVRGRIGPAWLGWWAIVAGVGLIAGRLENAAKMLGPGRVTYVHPDCGFWMLQRSVADGKMRALVSGRDLFEGRT